MEQQKTEKAKNAELRVRLIKELMLLIDVMPDDYLPVLVDQVRFDYQDWIEDQTIKYKEEKCKA